MSRAGSARRVPTGGGALTVAVLLPLLLLAQPGWAAGASSAGAERRCVVVAQRYLARRPRVEKARRRILRLLAAKRYPEAARELRSAVARYRSPWAAYALAQLYSTGLGVARSSHSAVHWYRWAAERGNMPAARQLVNAYLHGTGTERSAARAAYWFRVGVAPEGLAGSAAALGAKYAAGAFMPRNPAMADYYQGQSVRILRRLVRQPNGPAEFALGSAYADGRGVKPDRARALQHLCRALALGFGPAAVRIRQIEGTR